jgi:hypothetical protein
MTWINRTERAVDYDGDLAVAAHEVIAELDDSDGIVIGSLSYNQLIRQKAKEHKVLRKDLEVRVGEFL